MMVKAHVMRLSGRLATAAAVAATVSLGWAADAEAAHRHVRHHHRHLVVRQNIPEPVSPFISALPIPGQNGVTTDTTIFPDLAVGDGDGGYQTPGLDAYGLNGGALYGSQGAR